MQMLERRKTPCRNRAQIPRMFQCWRIFPMLLRLEEVPRSVQQTDAQRHRRVAPLCHNIRTASALRGVCFGRERARVGGWRVSFLIGEKEAIALRFRGTSNLCVENNILDCM